MGRTRNAYSIFKEGDLLKKGELRGPWKWEDNMQTSVREICCEDGRWT
jgi:hypothetical protein